MHNPHEAPDACPVCPDSVLSVKWTGDGAVSGKIVTPGDVHSLLELFVQICADCPDPDVRGKVRRKLVAAEEGLLDYLDHHCAEQAA